MHQAHGVAVQRLQARRRLGDDAAHAAGGQQRIERPGAVLAHGEGIDHQAVRAVVPARDRHAQREGQRRPDRRAAVDQGVELAVARRRRLVVVRAVAVVRHQPHDAGLPLQHAVDGAVHGFAEVGIGQRRAARLAGRVESGQYPRAAGPWRTPPARTAAPAATARPAATG
jgi:hypothetical protein